MENCTISIEESPLSGTWKVENLWGELPFDQISFDNQGALVDFELMPLMSGGETLILSLRK